MTIQLPFIMGKSCMFKISKNKVHCCCNCCLLTKHGRRSHLDIISQLVPTFSLHMRKIHTNRAAKVWWLWDTGLKQTESNTIIINYLINTIISHYSYTHQSIYCFTLHWLLVAYCCVFPMIKSYYGVKINCSVHTVLLKGNL